MTAVICSILPALPSQRGDSGIQIMPINYPIEAIAMPPSIHLQCGLSKKHKPAESICAKVITSTLNATSYPLTSFGATSDRYKGTI